MPVIESAPVTMKMAVEEGWYGKAGSKWQTELRALMFQYRAGSFFGNIHAPDIVMGMGRTSEEERDIIDIHDDGSYTVSRTTIDELRGGPAPAADVVEPQATPAAAEVKPGAQQDDLIPADDGQSAPQTVDGPTLTFKDVNRELLQAENAEDLDFARSLIKQVPDEKEQATLHQVASRRMRELSPPADDAPAAQQTTRRQREPINAD